MKALFDCHVSQIPEPYPFEYIALAPWPRVYDHGFNLDWIDSIERVEVWLERSVGSHWDRWMWATCSQQEYWECCVAFRRAPDRTLFLLQWGQ